MSPTVDREELRRRGEREATEAPASGELPAGPNADPQRLAHELRVHQAELEMQYDELLRAQEQLEESRRELAELYEQAPVGYVTLDQRTTVLRANLTAADMLGRPRSAVVGRPLASLCTDGTADALHRHLAQAREAGGAPPCDVRVRQPDGSRRWFRVVSRGATDDAFFAALLDVSEERRLQGELARAARTEAIGRLASGIAHDFNNLLMGIIGCADRALDQLEPDQGAQPWVLSLRDAAREGSAMAVELVGLGREESDQPERVDVNAVVARNENLLRRLVGEAVRVEVSLSPEPALARCAVGTIPQLLMNLVANARDAMAGPGALSISVDTVGADERPGSRPASLGPGPFVVLTVTDTGAGMDAVTLDHIFEPYFSTKERPGSSGLGLATTYAAVRKYGGDVEVHSAPGLGATFRVWLPRAGAEQRLEPGGTRGTVQVAEARLVLVVEDDPLVRMAARYYLERGGYAVVEADSVATAQERADAQPPAAVLTDIVLPDGGGKDVVARVRGAGPDVPVVFMSAYPRGHLLERGLVVEADVTVGKPFGQPEVLDALALVLRESAAAPPR